MRTLIGNLIATIEILCDDREFEMLVKGLDQVKAGQTRSLAEIKRSLKEGAT